MTENRTFLTAVLCGTVLCVPAIANNCDNEIYRRYNPDRCKDYTSTDSGLSFGATAGIIGGSAALIGGTIALLGLSSSGDDGTPGNSRTSVNYVQPTLPSYTLVGADIDEVSLSSITSNREYSRNHDQYNEIRLAYSLARGYTGKNSTIAVLDSGKNSYHGSNVAYLAGAQIAPDATIKSYQVSYGQTEFKSFYEIGNVINSATADGANIYNFSWAATNASATDIRNYNQMVNNTDKNFINSLKNAANQNDAIFVWAAGNEYNSQSSALSALPLHVPELQGHFVNVVAYDTATESLAYFSNACGITQNYCITAPGMSIDSPKSDTPLDGTSFAAPIVSAAVAVLHEAHPYLKSSEILSLLFDTARDIGTPGIDATYGHGLLDLERATRPVGASLVPISDTVTVSLRKSHISGTIGHQIKSENITFAFVDSYGRPFNTQLNDNISIKNRSIGFEHLTANNNPGIQFKNIEFGFRPTNLFSSDGFLSTDSQNIITYVGFNNNLNIGEYELFHRTTIGTTNPTPSSESIISGFSNIYTASIEFGVKHNDWRFSIGTPDTIIAGQMNLRTASGRRTNGEYKFNTHTIDLATRPSIAFNATYKHLTVGFVDNPYGRDEVYTIAKTKLQF